MTKLGVVIEELEALQKLLFLQMLGIFFLPRYTFYLQGCSESVQRITHACVGGMMIVVLLLTRSMAQDGSM